MQLSLMFQVYDLLNTLRHHANLYCYISIVVASQLDYQETRERAVHVSMQE